MNNRLLPKIGFVISVLVLLALGGTQVALAGQGLNFTTIDVPGADLTFALGINAKGDIVGLYSNDATSVHGFVLSKEAFTFL